MNTTEDIPHYANWYSVCIRLLILYNICNKLHDQFTPNTSGNYSELNINQMYNSPYNLDKKVLFNQFVFTDV